MRWRESCANLQPCPATIKMLRLFSRRPQQSDFGKSQPKGGPLRRCVTPGQGRIATPSPAQPSLAQRRILATKAPQDTLGYNIALPCAHEHGAARAQWTVNLYHERPGQLSRLWGGGPGCAWNRTPHLSTNGPGLSVLCSDVGSLHIDRLVRGDGHGCFPSWTKAMRNSGGIWLSGGGVGRQQHRYSLGLTYRGG